MREKNLVTILSLFDPKKQRAKIQYLIFTQYMFTPFLCLLLFANLDLEGFP